MKREFVEAISFKFLEYEKLDITYIASDESSQLL